MSFDNYDGLKEEAASFLWNRADVIARIPSLIQLAEAEARRLLRTRQTVSRRQFAYAGGITGIPGDAGQIDAINVVDGSGTRDIDYMSPEEFSSLNASAVGTPRFYTVQNDRIYFHPTGAFSGTMVYVDEFTPLSDANPTNWLLKKHPDIYLCGVLKWGKAWLIDSDWDWATPFYAAIQAANAHTPRVQANTKLRADEATMMGSRRGGYSIMTDSWGSV